MPRQGILSARYAGNGGQLFEPSRQLRTKKPGIHDNPFFSTLRPPFLLLEETMASPVYNRRIEHCRNSPHLRDFVKAETLTSGRVAVVMKSAQEGMAL